MFKLNVDNHTRGFRKLAVFDFRGSGSPELERTANNRINGRSIYDAICMQIAYMALAVEETHRIQKGEHDLETANLPTHSTGFHPYHVPGMQALAVHAPPPFRSRLDAEVRDGALTHVDIHVFAQFGFTAFARNELLTQAGLHVNTFLFAPHLPPSAVDPQWDGVKCDFIFSDLPTQHQHIQSEDYTRVRLLQDRVADDEVWTELQYHGANFSSDWMTAAFDDLGFYVHNSRGKGKSRSASRGRGKNSRSRSGGRGKIGRGGLHTGRGGAQNVA